MINYFISFIILMILTTSSFGVEVGSIGNQINDLQAQPLNQIVLQEPVNSKVSQGLKEDGPKIKSAQWKYTSDKEADSLKYKDEIKEKLSKEKKTIKGYYYEKERMRGVKVDEEKKSNDRSKKENLKFKSGGNVKYQPMQDPSLSK